MDHIDIISLIYIINQLISLYPPNICLLKVNNRSTRERCGTWSMMYFTHFSDVSIVDFEKVNVYWVSNEMLDRLSKKWSFSTLNSDSKGEWRWNFTDEQTPSHLWPWCPLDNHVKPVLDKVNKTIDFFWKFKQVLLRQSSLTTISNAFQTSHLDYGDITFDQVFINSFHQSWNLFNATLL